MSPTTTAADCCASRTQPGAGNYNESASSAPRFEGGGSAVVAPRAKEGACRGEMTGDLERAAFLLRNEPRAFGYKTADGLIQEGRTDAVIAYLESLAGGAAG